MNRRMERVNVLLREEISRILANELNDPRISTIVSITHVEASPDLRHAKVHVSVFGDEQNKRNTIIALKSASGFINRTMRSNITLKNAPFLSFFLDESIERDAEMLNMIEEQVSSLPEREEGT